MSYTEKQLIEAYNTSEAIYYDPNSTEEQKLQNYSNMKSIQAQLASGDYIATPPIQKAEEAYEGYIGAVSRKAEEYVKGLPERFQERQENFKRAVQRAEGDQLLQDELGVQAMGETGGFLVGDVAAGAAGVVVPETVKQFVFNAADAAMSTPAGQYIVDFWNDLPEDVQDYYEAVANTAAIVSPRLPAGPAAKSLSTGVRLNRLNRTFFDPFNETRDGKEIKARRTQSGAIEGVLGESPEQQAMVAQLKDTPGIKWDNTPKKNHPVLVAAIEKEAKTLENALKESNIVVDQTLIGSELAKVYNEAVEKALALVPDQTIAKNYALAQDRMIESINKHGYTANGLLQARKEFDKLVRDYVTGKKQYDETDFHRVDYAAKMMRDMVNDIIDKSVPSAEVKKSLKKQRLWYRAIDSLVHQYTKNTQKGAIGTVVDLANRHPFIALGLLTGSGVGAAAYSNQGLALGATAGLGAGAYFAGKRVPDGLFSLAKASETPVGKVAEIPPKRMMLYGEPEEQQ